MNSGQFKNGPDNRRANGRPKGSKNNFTKIKDSFLEVFEQLGGANGLAKWAAQSPRNRTYFYQMIARMLPNKVIEETERENKLTIQRIIISDKLLPKMDQKKISNNMK